MPIDEITVRGRPLEPRVPIREGQRVAPAPPEGRRFEPPLLTPPTPADPPRETRPPPVPPVLLPEIVVRGTAPARPPVGFGPAARFNLGTLFAVVGGLLVSRILEDRSQALLDEAFAEFERPTRRRPDSPLQTIAPEVLTEIVVTGKRPFPQVAPLPSPLITPDFDPFILIPFVPRPLVEPGAVPAPDIATPELPVEAPATIPQPLRIPNVPTRFFPQTIPSPLPLRTPQRVSPQRRTTTSPQVSPSVAPGIQPSVQPSVRPFVSPSISTDPLTQLRRRLAQSTQRQTQFRPRTQAVPATAGGQCPPCPQCKKDEETEKARDECWKKLVKEGLFPSLDRSYDWVEIDCLTGREL